MQLFKCGQADISTLAALNKQLIEDEGYDVTYTLEQLEARMKDLLSGSYQAVYLMEDGKILGYSLYSTAAAPVYLRHFFICREQRRKGNGRAFIKLLLEYLNTDTLDIEVLIWNETGRAFWEGIGFKPRSLYMRFKKDGA
jgi:GNAT superfamily N-acetyltransferase